MFEGQAKCSSCHSGSSFTDVDTFGLHPASASVALDKNYIKFSATKQWRVTPLKGIWQHPPYFHDGSGRIESRRPASAWMDPTSAAWPAQRIG